MTRMLAILMMLLLQSVPFVELMHHHAHEEKQYHSHDDSLDVETMKCQLCEHILQQQLHFFHDPEQLSFIVQALPYPKVYVPGSARILFLPGLSWSNKGPPVA